jgi:hypothetical protein
MNCHEFREQVAVRLADPSEPADGHGASCAECARYAELARAAWEAAGKSADEAVPPGVSERLLQTGRRPRRADLTLLRPGPLAAAAILVVGLLALLWPATPAKPDGPLFEGGGMSVERYELPAGADAAQLAEEIRKEVAPEAWREGEVGLEPGDGFLRVRATAEVHQAIRQHLRRTTR